MRKIVRDFSEDLEKTLMRNDTKPCWTEESELELLEHLRLEIAELEAAIIRRYASERSLFDRQRIMEEACDVAAMAMFLWDRNREKPSRKRGTI